MSEIKGKRKGKKKEGKSRHSSRVNEPDEVVVRLHEFPMFKIKLCTKIVVIGKPGSGKSVLLEDIAYNVKHKIPVAAIWAGTEDSNDAWKRVIPSLFVFNCFSEEGSKRAVTRQKIAKKVCNIPQSLLLWDDCTDDAKYFYLVITKKIFKNGRHYEGIFLYSLQFALDMKPIIRGNVDYAFLLMEKNKSNRERLFKNYGSSIPDFNTFNALMDQVTDDYGCIVIDNTTKSNEFEKTVFYYRAQMHDKWKFGCKEYRQWADERYDTNYVEPFVD
jgi:energy-coupling factor transporter ATP-binding protein EcfA2